jgi:hypothetical protein
MDRTEAAAARAQRIEAARAVLAEAVAGIRDGEGWERFLGFQSSLHAYSANNSLLIAVQHEKLFEAGKVATPLPSYVAPYRKWQELGRHVEKGQTGLAVIAPMRGLRREAVDPDGNARPLAADDQPGDGERERKTPYMRGFTVEKVFSAEQTAGEPLPEPPTPKLLEGDAPAGLAEAVVRLIESKGYSVSAVPSAQEIGGANGLTTWADKRVRVRGDVDAAAAVKTLIHEAAHVLLHDPADSVGAVLPRGHKEVEAESVAFIAADAHGLPTGDYSFAYVAHWAGEDHEKTIAATAQRVARAAKEIIAASPAEHTDGGRPASPVRVAAVAVAEPMRREAVGW